MKFQTITKSDELNDLRKLFSEGGVFAQFGNIFQISLILDANTVLADIRWKMLKANTANARTSLQESIDSSVIVAFAPTFLNEEMETHLPRIAAEARKEEAVAYQHWEEYKERITFIDVGGPEDNDVDPKDMPYVNLQKLTGYLIATSDKDISNMGAKAIEVKITTLTRNYSRKAAVEYRIKFAGISTIIVGSVLIRTTVKFIRSIVGNVERIPDWAWLLLIGGSLWVWSNKNFRIWVMRTIESLPKSSMRAGQALLSEINEAFNEFSECSKDSNIIRDNMENKFGLKKSPK